MEAFVALKTDPEEGRFLVVVYDTQSNQAHALLMPEVDIYKFRVGNIVGLNLREEQTEIIEGDVYNYADFSHNLGNALPMQAFQWQFPIRDFMQKKGWCEDILFEGKDALKAMENYLRFFEDLGRNDGLS